MHTLHRRALLRIVPSFFAVGLSSLLFSGCSNEVNVAPEYQAEGRKSKAEALQGITSPKDAKEAPSKSRTKRKQNAPVELP
jgi:hypothetical protein